MRGEEMKRQKARALRYKKAALEGLNYEYIRSELEEIAEECYSVRYYTESEDGTLLNAFDGDEEEEFEFRIMFSELTGKCEELESVIDEYFPEIFDDFFVGIMLKNKSPYKIIGYDIEEEDYFGLLGYEEEAAENESFRRLMKMKKEDIISEAGRCFAAAVLFLDIRERYSYLKAAFDILRNENTSYLQLIRDIDKSYAEAEQTDDWNRFDRLIQTLPDKAWIE